MAPYSGEKWSDQTQCGTTQGGDKVRWFSVELAEGQADWYAYLDISAWKGESTIRSLELYELKSTW